ncbi:MAG: HAD family hydrolase [Rhodoferax sp.]|uniref:HAD family hydrolase n=1 Tax=Rhodoferax sp. TaxID=50421 RepID=UPI003265A263
MTVDTVFLLDVDNTLLDGDSIVSDMHAHFISEFGISAAQRYWDIFDQLRIELGYVDYLGALQRFRLEVDQGSIEERRLLTVSSFFIDFPFADRLYPRALEVIEYLGRFGQTVLLTDGDVVLQPHKLQRSGLWDAVEGRALVYVHKEQSLHAVEFRYPARQYVMVDDKLRILAAMKTIWRERLTTVFVRQGHYAQDPAQLAAQPDADVTVERIGELADLSVSHLLGLPIQKPHITPETL